MSLIFLSLSERMQVAWAVRAIFPAQMRFWHFLLWLSLSLGVVQAQAEVLRLDAAAGRVATNGYLARLEGEAGEAPLDLLADEQRWTRLPGAPSAGYRPEALWLRVEVALAANALPQRWLLQFTNALLDEVDVYIPDGEGGWQQRRSGESLGRAVWEFDARSVVLPLELPGKGVTTLLLRLQARNALATEIVFWEPGAYERAARREALAHGLYFGAYLLLILFHAFFWRMTREAQSGWYLLYVCCNVAIDLLSVGLPQQYLLLPGWWSDMALGLAICASPLVGTRFALLQLELEQVWPRCSRLLLHFCLLFSLFSGGWVLAGEFATGVVLAQKLALCLIPAFVVAALWLLGHGHAPARFYLLAFGIFYLGVAVSFTRNLGLLPTNFWTLNAASLGTLIHLLLMSLRLNMRYDSLRRETALAQENAVAAMTVFSENLEREVERRTRDLLAEIQRRQVLESELRAALDTERRTRAEQKEFVAMISHEFRTPLSIISTTAQQLAKNPEAPWEKTMQRCRNLRSATERMQRLVDEYLAADRMEAEASAYKPIACDARELLLAIIDEWVHERVALMLAEQLPQLICDPGLLRVAVRNLIANALRHSPESEMVYVEASLCGDAFEIRVRNRGEAIPADEVGRLFQKYFRGRQAQQQAGAGLGLYLVQRIAQLHAGEVSLADRGEAGEVVFVLRLPARLSLPDSATQPPAISQQTLGREILHSGR